MKVVWLGLMVFAGISAQGQTFAEWFRQTKTEKKYYLQQIAALQVYAAALEKGYGMVEAGLHTIGDIKTGEFNEHRLFYGGLSTINPAILSMAELAEIIGLQEAVVERFASALKRYRQGAGLSGGEFDYLGSAYSMVLDAGLKDVSLLLEVLTAGAVKMTDDERMACVRGLDERMKGRFAFAVQLTNQADLLCLQRRMEGASAGTVKGLYGVP